MIIKKEVSLDVYFRKRERIFMVENGGLGGRG